MWEFAFGSDWDCVGVPSGVFILGVYSECVRFYRCPVFRTIGEVEVAEFVGSEISAKYDGECRDNVSFLLDGWFVGGEA